MDARETLGVMQTATGNEKPQVTKLQNKVEPMMQEKQYGVRLEKHWIIRFLQQQ